MSQAAPTTADHDPAFAAFEGKLVAKGYKPRGWLDVIDQCDFHDRKTNQKVSLDRDRLQRMADKRNHLVLSRESVSHYCLGHTKDDAPEWEQPPVAGLASRWRVGSYPNGDPNLEAYSWEKPGHEGVFDEYPQRSAELFLNPDDINPIALLKSTTPRRDLSLRLSSGACGADFDDPTPTSSPRSLVRFWRADDGGRHPILFTMRGDMADPTTPVKCDAPADGAPAGASPDDESIQKIANSDWGKRLMSLVEQCSAGLQKIMPVFEQIEAEATGGDAGAGPDGAAPPPPEGAAPGGPAGAAPPAGPPAGPPGGPPPEEDEPPVKNAMGAAPGAGSGYIPGPDREPTRHSRAPYTPPTPGPAMHDTAVRLQRLEAQNAEAVKLAKAKDDKIVKLESELDAIKLARVTDEVNGLLDGLERDGFTVVRDVDAETLRHTTDRPRAVQFMRDTRARKDVTPLPNAGKLPVAPEQVLVPIQFSRTDDGPGLPGDPSLVPNGVGGGLTASELATKIIAGRGKGLTPQAVLEAERTPNGVKVH